MRRKLGIEKHSHTDTQKERSGRGTENKENSTNYERVKREKHDRTEGETDRKGEK